MDKYLLFFVLLTTTIIACDSNEHKRNVFKELLNIASETERKIAKIEDDRKDYYKNIFKNLDAQYHTAVKAILVGKSSEIDLHEEPIEGLNSVFSIGASVVSIFQDAKTNQAAEKLIATDIVILKKYKKEYDLENKNLTASYKACYSYLKANPKIFDPNIMEESIIKFEKLLQIGEYARKKKPSVWSLVDGIFGGGSSAGSNRAAPYEIRDNIVTCNMCNGSGNYVDVEYNHLYTCSKCSGSGRIYYSQY